MGNFESFKAFVENVELAPAWEYASPKARGYANNIQSRVYKQDDLIAWVCRCAEKANYDMRRIDEDPEKKKELIASIAIGLGVALLTGDAIPTEPGVYLASKLVSDAAHKYMQDHPSLRETMRHIPKDLGL
jgi:hypothetical protein